MIGIDVNQHDNIWINEAGEEVCAPTVQNKEAFKQLKPDSEKILRPSGMPPKSWAEIYREKEEKIRASMDDESLKALELLRSKGIL